MILSRLVTLLRQMPKKGQFYYAVRNGRTIGVFGTWPECEAQVKGYPRPIFKKFSTEQEAWSFVHRDANSEVRLSNGTSGTSCHSVGTLDVSRKRKLEDNTPESLAKAFRTDDDEDMLHVYTDGACSNNGTSGIARAGIGVYWGPNNPMNVSERLPGRQTNNRAEIHAAVRACEQVHSLGCKNVTIYTDSAFLINSMTKWMDGWIKRNWRLSDGQAVKNKEDFQDLLKAAEGLRIKWVHVRGHCGIDGNVEADRLAVAALNQPLPPG
uniref:Ribonuclease H1 n=1 Tax=Ornithodoros turicata TaxID=34597 RepID=A0A2R5LAB8_9ACAR